MNADDLYELLCNGATLTSRWKRRHSFQAPRMIHRLRLSDADYIDLQKSLISALVRKGKLRSVLLQASQYDYEVIR